MKKLELGKDLDYGEYLELCNNIQGNNPIEQDSDRDYLDNMFSQLQFPFIPINLERLNQHIEKEKDLLEIRYGENFNSNIVLYNFIKNYIVYDKENRTTENESLLGSYIKEQKKGETHSHTFYTSLINERLDSSENIMILYHYVNMYKGVLNDDLMKQHLMYLRVVYYEKCINYTSNLNNNQYLVRNLDNKSFYDNDILSFIDLSNEYTLKINVDLEGDFRDEYYQNIYPIVVELVSQGFHIVNYSYNKYFKIIGHSNKELDFSFIEKMNKDIVLKVDHMDFVMKGQETFIYTKDLGENDNEN